MLMFSSTSLTARKMIFDSNADIAIGASDNATASFDGNNISGQDNATQINIDAGADGATADVDNNVLDGVANEILATSAGAGEAEVNNNNVNGNTNRLISSGGPDGVNGFEATTGEATVDGNVVDGNGNLLNAQW